MDELLTAEVRHTVTVYARHRPNCKFTSEAKLGKCLCREYILVSPGDKRSSANTRSWADAERQAQKIRDSYDPVKRELAELKAQRSRVSQPVEAALHIWIADEQKNGAAPETVACLNGPAIFRVYFLT